MANNEDYKYKTVLKRFKLKTLSPLHIADSEPWKKDFDYICKSRKVFFIDYDDFLRQLDIDFLRKTDDMEIYRSHMNAMFEQRKLKIQRDYSLAQEPADIYPFIRESFTPLIPGSSIKGAIRTAVLSEVILKKLAKKESISTSPEKYLEKKVGNKEDNIKRSMEAIQIRDLSFTGDQLKLFSFSSYSLSRNEFIEKKGKTRLVEAIPANVSLKQALEIRLVYREMDKNRFLGIPEIVDFSQTLRDHYKRWIPREIEILKKYPSKSIASVIQFYESLMKKLEAGALLLHVGFGTGWQSKTGAFLKKNRFMWRNDIQDYLNNCKSAHQKEKHIFTKVQRDGRYKNYPFPKSRKFVMSGNALLPPGWVEIREEEVKP